MVEMNTSSLNPIFTTHDSLTDMNEHVQEYVFPLIREYRNVYGYRRFAGEENRDRLAREQNLANHNRENAQLVREQAGCDDATAMDCLIHENGDIVNAIMRWTFK